MFSKPHRNNSDFQLRYLIAGSCYTVDGAWILLYEQRIDIKVKLELTKAKLLKRKANKLEIDQKLAQSLTEIEKLRAEAELIEWQSSEGLLELAVQGAEAELKTIQQLMDELEPHRKYAHLPLLEASEATQREEFLGEFKGRIENYLMSIGTIPEDQLAAMRKHPDFESDIVPHIKKTMQKLEQSRDKTVLLMERTSLLLEDKNDLC
jgi:hypothetical protein